MQRFDCLSLDCPLFGPHLLEASAGTGKTFSIEHIFVRLILESMETEQILVVTFTRAATRELKARIRANLEKALYFISTNEPVWEYLQPHLGSADAIRKLTDALAAFDRCQIFTIHRFCYRMLLEFSFEAKVGSLSDPEEGPKIPRRLKEAVHDFLQCGLDENLVCQEQLLLLTKEFDSIQEIEDRLLRLEDVGATLSFSARFSQCKAALHPWGLQEAKLFEDFDLLRKNYKAGVKGDFETQLRALVKLEFFPTLLKGRGTIFDFVSPLNQKVKVQTPAFLHYPGFFDWARLHIAPLVQQEVFPILQSAWNPIAEKILSEEEYLDPDEILLQMKRAIQNSTFADAVRKKYGAAIIDEFQDTDAVQWEIFQQLFIQTPLRALYLVGDPKQSIYRFRRADVYIYLGARDSLGEQNLYQLDTNFRSSKPLIDALNTLFSRDWLYLPKVDRTLPYKPVQAGAKIDSTFADEKGALHFFFAEGEPHILFDEIFLPAAVREIEQLQLKNCALLVKDRYQAQKALDFLRKRNIPAIAKSHMPLGQTVAFQAIRELFEAILSPRDKSAVNIVMAGPFAKEDLPLFEYKILLEEKGLVPFAQELILDSDAMQIFEHLFAWEKKEGFSFTGLLTFLKTFEDLDLQEGGRRRIEVDEEAVQIMTLHISKGLEFDVVFALGLASRTPGGGDELDAEKLRQLYVAMTRAKRRLYIPIVLSSKESPPGTYSPIELFSRHFEGSLLTQLQTLTKTHSITIEHLSSPLSLSPPAPSLPPQQLLRLPPHPFSPFFLSSFTTLAPSHPIETNYTASPLNLFTMQTMPRGSGTGIIVHQIFESLFKSPQRNITAVVAEELRFSPLLPWKEAIEQMIHQTLAMPIEADGKFFSLNEIDRFQVEMEFLFSSPPNFVKGFIDLVFFYRNKVYFLDWKTNWLPDYTPPPLQEAMRAHGYGLQASLYKEAIQRHFRIDFGGAYYFFVRGGTYCVVE